MYSLSTHILYFVCLRVSADFFTPGYITTLGLAKLVTLLPIFNSKEPV